MPRATTAPRALSRGLRTALACLVATLAALAPAVAPLAAAPAYADEEPFARTVDEIAAALKRDPVLVHQVLGNGDTAGAEARLRATVAEAKHPVYVALVAKPDGLSVRNATEDLATRLHARLGDGIFIVGLPSDVFIVESWGVPERTELSLARYDASAKAHRMAGNDRRLADVAEAQIAATIAVRGEPWGIDDAALDAIASAPWAVRPDSVPRDYELDAATDGGRAVVATVVGLGVLLVGWRALLWATARRRHPAAAKTPPIKVSDLDLAELVARADDDSTRLATQLATAPASEHADTATGCLSAAEMVLRRLDPLAKPEDARAYGRQLRDAVGALVLARSGLDELRRPERPNDRGRYTPCFFNPLHGQASDSIEVPARATVVVPSCRRCARAAENGRSPEALVFAYPPQRRPRPYYEEKTLWARAGYGALDGELWRTVTAESAEAGR